MHPLAGKDIRNEKGSRHYSVLSTTKSATRIPHGPQRQSPPPPVSMKINAYAPLLHGCLPGVGTPLSSFAVSASVAACGGGGAAPFSSSRPICEGSVHCCCCCTVSRDCRCCCCCYCAGGATGGLLHRIPRAESREQRKSLTLHITSGNV